jgi:hypothetical protein
MRNEKRKIITCYEYRVLEGRNSPTFKEYYSALIRNRKALIRDRSLIYGVVRLIALFLSPISAYMAYNRLMEQAKDNDILVRPVIEKKEPVFVRSMLHEILDLSGIKFDWEVTKDLPSPQRVLTLTKKNGGRYVSCGYVSREVASNSNRLTEIDNALLRMAVLDILGFWDKSKSGTFCDPVEFKEYLYADGYKSDPTSRAR